MTRDLPHTVPMVVRTAAAEAFAEYGRVEAGRAVAESAYHEHIALDRRRRAQPDGELAAMSTGLFNWGVEVHKALIVDQLEMLDQMRRRDEVKKPLRFAIVSHQIALGTEPTAPEGKLKTQLDIEFDPEGWRHDSAIIRHHGWFDGYRVNGGGILNSATAFHTTLHSKMLREIHALVAEGTIWERIVFDFRQLAASLKDR